MIGSTRPLTSFESAAPVCLRFLELALLAQEEADHVHGGQRVFMINSQRMFLFPEPLLHRLQILVRLVDRGGDSLQGILCCSQCFF